MNKKLNNIEKAINNNYLGNNTKKNTKNTTNTKNIKSKKKKKFQKKLQKII